MTPAQLGRRRDLVEVLNRARLDTSQLRRLEGILRGVPLERTPSWHLLPAVDRHVGSHGVFRYLASVSKVSS